MICAMDMEIEAQNTAAAQVSVANVMEGDEANEIAAVDDDVSKGGRLAVLEPAVDDGSVVKTAGTLFFTSIEVVEGLSLHAPVISNHLFK